MTETSPKLGLPYIQPAQAQKHVTHNEAIRELDTLVQLRITEFGTETAPGTPALGETHALGPVPGGPWAEQGGNLATWDGEAWQFLTPQEGWLAWDIAASRLRSHAGGNWVYPDLTGDQLARLGIVTAADDTNRLAVASEAVLFTHAGGDHRLKLNKAANSDTASLVFQSNWSGHAEMGLTGDTGFSLKVSADGSNWTQVMWADPAALQVDVPLTGAAVQSGATDTTAGRLMRADYGYGPGNLVGVVGQVSGIPTGAVLERGANANGEYIRFADGTQICWQSNGEDLDAASASGSIFRSAISGNWIFPAQFANSSIFVSAQPDSSARWCYAQPASSTAAVFRQFQGMASGTLVNTRLQAVGRWF